MVTASPPKISAFPESFSFLATIGLGNPDPQLLDIRNDGEEPLDWRVETDLEWLTLDPISGQTFDASAHVSLALDVVTVSVDISDLSEGTYQGSITIVDPKATNSPRTVIVTVVVEAPPVPSGLVLSEITGLVSSQDQTLIETADGQVQLVFPAGALPRQLSGDVVEVSVKLLHTDTVPQPAEGIVLLRALEVTTLVDGEPQHVDYAKPVELIILLTPEELELAGGDPSKIGVARFNPLNGDWESVPTTYEHEPPPAGRLVASLDSFSLFAVGLFPNSVSAVAPEPTTTPTPTTPSPSPTPTTTPAPTPTATPTPTPTPTVTPARPAPTATPLPPTPAATPTPSATATATPEPKPPPTATATATSTPEPPPTIPAAFPITGPPGPPTPSEGGGLSGLGIGLLVLGVVVALGVATSGAGYYWYRRMRVP